VTHPTLAFRDAAQRGFAAAEIGGHGGERRVAFFEALPHIGEQFGREFQPPRHAGARGLGHGVAPYSAVIPAKAGIQLFLAM